MKDIDEKFPNIFKIEQIYDSGNPGTITEDNSMNIKCYVNDKYEMCEKRFNVKFGSWGDYHISIWRIKKDLMSQHMFKSVMFAQNILYIGSKYADKYAKEIDREYNRFTFHQNHYENEMKTAHIKIVAKQLGITLYRDSISELEDIDKKLLEIKYEPKSLTEAFKSIYVYFETNIEPSMKDLELFDEDYQKVNYKKILSQKLFGNVNFSDFTNFDVFHFDGNSHYLYFEIGEYMYTVCQSSS